MKLDRKRGMFEFAKGVSGEFNSNSVSVFWIATIVQLGGQRLWCNKLSPPVNFCTKMLSTVGDLVQADE